MEAELADGIVIEDDTKAEGSTIEAESTAAKLLTTPFTLPPPKFRNDASGSNRISPLPTTISTSSTKATSSISPVPTSLPTPSVTPVSAVAVEDTALSARERNKLKRKLKSEGKNGVPSPSIVLPPPAKKVKSLESETPTPSISTTTSLATTPIPESKVESKDSESLTGVGGEMVIIDPGAKAREGGEVKVEEGQDKKKDMEVDVGEWPWKKTVEKLAIGLLS